MKEIDINIILLKYGKYLGHMLRERCTYIYILYFMYTNTCTYKPERSCITLKEKKDITYHTICYLRIHTSIGVPIPRNLYIDIYKHVFSHITPFNEDRKEKIPLLTPHLLFVFNFELPH